MSGRLAIAAVVAAALLTGGCELGRKDATQTGYRGAGLQQITDPDNVRKAAAIPAAPYALGANLGPPARATYQNVQVLGDVPTEEFNLLMAKMNSWVSPGTAADQGCNYCHNPNDMASDEKYTKVVARRMIQMTRAVNSRWASHVQGTGVTCWTCHRGNNVPEYKWAVAETAAGRATIRANKRGQNSPDANIGYASLPYDPFDHYLGRTSEIRVATSSSYPQPDHRVSLKEAEQSYGLMMHVSQSLGVNCTYCHNSQSFRAWTLSRAQRATAYYGIRMVRDINADYITPLAATFPANRKGIHGDPYKVNCMTCHQGLAKPLNGVSMLADNGWARGGAAPVAPAEGAPAPAVVEAFRDPGGITQRQ